MNTKILFAATAAALAVGTADAVEPPTKRSFGRLSDGTETTLYTLRGAGGLVLDVADYGGRLVRCYAPDRFGNLADVTLGWKTAAEYERISP